MPGDFKLLQDWEEGLKKIGSEEFPLKVAKASAPKVEDQIKSTAANGQAPDGTAWPATKDGGRPLANAASKVSTQAQGKIVLTRLQGPEVYHHLGISPGAPRRQVIPDAEQPTPDKVQEAIKQGVREVLKEVLPHA